MVEVTLDGIRDIRLYQFKHGYRFSVDALLVYHFVDIPRVKKIADLGAGSGIVGLLLAKKYPESEVTLFELQQGLASLARRNVALNSLTDRVSVINADIRNMTSHTAQGNSFDIAVSNPPFRKPRTGLISQEEEKAVARHEINLNLPELVSAADRLLKAKGRFFLVYHPERLAELVETLRKERMEVKRLRFVHSSVSSTAKMVLVEAVKDGRRGLKVERPFYIYDESGAYTDEMRHVYGDG